MALTRTNYHYYEFNNKTSKLLAWQMRKKEDSEKYIYCIKVENGRGLEDPKDKFGIKKTVDKDLLDVGISEEVLSTLKYSLKKATEPFNQHYQRGTRQSSITVFTGGCNNNTAT